MYTKGRKINKRISREYSMILNTSPQVEAYRFICTKLVIKMYLILFDADSNATP